METTVNKKLLLISANRYITPYPVYPIGVSYLKTYLDKHLSGFDVELFDMNRGDEAALAQLIQRLNPEYIGISIRNVDGANSFDRTTFISGYQQIITTIRANSHAVLILGGAGFSVFPQTMFQLLEPDFAIQGEGEQAICKLIQALETSSDYAAIEGLIYYDENKQLQENKHSHYLDKIELEVEDDIARYYWSKSGMLNIQTKRGCCYNCIYCTYPLIDGRKVRTFDPKQIVENLMRLQKDKGIDYVFFTDSVFNINNKYNYQLCEEFIRSGLKMHWGAYFSPRDLPDDLVKLCKQAGLTHVEFGTESLSEGQLARYGKLFSVSDVLSASESCLKHGVYYAHFLILGGYGETDETIRETMENSKRMSYTVYFPYVGMRIYPRTKLHEIAIAEGLVSPQDTLLDPSYYISANFDATTLKEKALATGKAWVFPDDPEDEMMNVLRTKKNKKGPIWEYLRKP